MEQSIYTSDEHTSQEDCGSKNAHLRKVHMEHMYCQNFVTVGKDPCNVSANRPQPAHNISSCLPESGS